MRYVVDLDLLAAGCRGTHCVRRVADSVLGPASAWILRPDPPGDAILKVRVRGGGGATRFATGLHRDAEGGYWLRASDLADASYTAIGAMRRSRVAIGAAVLDVIFLGPPLAMGDVAALGWIRGAASSVAEFFGRFPVDATVFVVPVRGAAEAVFGSVLSLAGASVELLFGDETQPGSYREDWVVVHEFFHLGTPSFPENGRWLEEGLATFYEPILRARGGSLGETELWRHFFEEMPRGLRRAGPDGAPLLDLESVYWGGALFALFADVRILQQTHGSRSLDDALRSVLARYGDATHMVQVRDFLNAADAATGTRVLEQLETELVEQATAVHLDELWHSLGVDVADDGTVTLRDDAPLAWARKSVSSGERH
jgi:hypothetical protein